MSGLETGLLKLAGQIVSFGVKSWLSGRRKKLDIEADLSELAAEHLSGALERRKLDGLVRKLEDQIIEQLQVSLSRNFAGLPENEANAALLAVSDVLNRADLSDQALLADDADPEKLSQRLRAQFPGRPEQVALAEDVWPLYDLALDQSCRYLIRVLRWLPSFQPRALAEVLSRLSTQEGQLTELLARTPRRSLLAPTGTGQDEEFTTEYLGYLERNLDRLHLLGLPALETRTTGTDLPPLSLTVAYLSLTVTEDGKPRERGPRHTDWFAQHAERSGPQSRRVEDALADRSRALLRGEAGSGKTTLLSWLAVTASRAQFTGGLEHWNGHVPFLIRLRNFAESPLPTPPEFVQHTAAPLCGLVPQGWTERRLRSGKALLLVDGVDEVTARRRGEVKSWLRGLLDAYPGMAVVVTSRTAAAEGQWLAEQDFGSVLLEPMSPPDVRELVQRWHTAAGRARPESDVDEARERILLQLADRADLRTLAATPLLAAMLCALNLAHRSRLPADRMALYRGAISMLLHLRDEERGIGSELSEQDKTILLRDLAWRLTLAGHTELSRTRMAEHVARKLPSAHNVDMPAERAAEELLIRSGVLQEPVPGRVEFLHRTFQEYFAAAEAIQQDHIETLVDNAHRDTWWETIVLACGHATAKQAGQLVGGILDTIGRITRRNRKLRLLTAACLETAPELPPEVTERVNAEIRENLMPPRNEREARSLARIGRRILTYLPTCLHGLTNRQAEAVVTAAGMTGHSHALPLLAQYANDQAATVVKMWKYFDAERFAYETVANADLRSADVTIQQARILPHIHTLRTIRSLSIDIFDTVPDLDLHFLEKLINLDFLRINARTNQIDILPLAKHNNISTLSIYKFAKIVNLSALQELPKLDYLALIGSRSFSELDFLADLNLKGFSISKLQDIEDFSALNTNRFLRDLTLDAGSTKLLMSTTTTFSSVDNIRLFNFPGEGLMELVTTKFPNAQEVLLWRIKGRLDLRPLAGHKLRLRLHHGDTHIGLDELGPGVKVTFDD